MAGTTGLEPATSAVTGQRSNQLSYVPRRIFCVAWTGFTVLCNNSLSLSEDDAQVVPTPPDCFPVYPDVSSLLALSAKSNKKMDAPERSVHRCLRLFYQESFTSGRTPVPSTRTAYRAAGLRSSASRMVGATCAVPTAA